MCNYDLYALKQVNWICATIVNVILQVRKICEMVTWSNMPNARTGWEV